MATPRHPVDGRVSKSELKSVNIIDSRMFVGLKGRAPACRREQQVCDHQRGMLHQESQWCARTATTRAPRARNRSTRIRSDKGLTPY
jgi:hypothetical protein